MTVSTRDGSGQRESQARVLRGLWQDSPLRRSPRSLADVARLSVTLQGETDSFSRGQRLPTPHPLVSLVVGLSVSCVYGLISQSSTYSRHFLSQEEFIESLSCARRRGTQ